MPNHNRKEEILELAEKSKKLYVRDPYIPYGCPTPLLEKLSRNYLDMEDAHKQITEELRLWAEAQDVLDNVIGDLEYAGFTSLDKIDVLQKLKKLRGE